MLQALGQGANDNDTQLVGAVLWALWCLTLSMGALGMAYLGRAAWRLGRGSWWRYLEDPIFFSLSVTKEP